MRTAHLAFLLVLLTGCVTQTYSSNRYRLVVADCIAAGWKTVPRSGVELPVFRQETSGYSVIGAGPPVLFSMLPLSSRHPTFAVWAEVHEAATGSTTEYFRAYQFTHERLDRVVTDCQGEAP